MRRKDTSEIRIEVGTATDIGPGSRCFGNFRPMTVDDADTAFVNGLIDVRDYTRCLVSVEPLVDTLGDASEQVRKSATFELKKRGGRKAVKLLEQALDDSSEEVRLFAAEALEKLDSMYNKAINGLIDRIKRDPSRRLYFLLGRVYFDYAYKGMYDTGLRELYYEKAVAEFEKALAVHGAPARGHSPDSDESVYLFLSSALYELGRYEDALKLFRRVKQFKGDDRDLLVREAAVFFALKRYDEVRRICRRIKKKFGKGRYGEILDLWTA